MRYRFAVIFAFINLAIIILGAKLVVVDDGNPRTLIIGSIGLVGSIVAIVLKRPRRSNTRTTQP